MILLSQEEAATLLAYAEEHLRAVVSSRPVPRPPSLSILDEEYGAFATLRKGRELRGCIGNFAGTGALKRVLPRVIREAALSDPRFPPVRAEELGELSLSISLLSPAEPVGGYEEIELGRHGIILTVGRNRAIFLPEVAVEQAWDLETTLEMLTRKAGALPGSWKGRNARFQVFETVKIGRHPDSSCPGVLLEPSARRMEGCVEPEEVSKLTEDRDE
ncbi:MAG: AmmeMemoRadiSam system protein A [Alkalispirochaetaceae bacterium]